MDSIQLQEQILHEVQTISKSYERVAEATGENFNLFSILNMESNEVSTHSNFIAELLNRNGSHGQKETFLNKFIECFNIQDFDTKNSRVFVEYYVGKVSEKNDMGGRIDILIEDGNNRKILIENKIYAGEQFNQLLRYHNAFPSANLLYLTLFGEKSTAKFSKYTAISYQTDIINWLESCKKEAVNVPILRETISQYINLVKKLTNQNVNQKMSQEIANRVLNNEESFNSLKVLVNSVGEIFKRILKETLFPLLENVKIENNLDLCIDKETLLNNSGKWMSFTYSNEKLKSLNVRIAFSFNVSKGYNAFIYGFSYEDQSIKQNHNYDHLRVAFMECFGQYKKTNGWPCWKDYSGFINWEDLGTLQKVQFGDFSYDFKDKVRKMLEISNSL